MALLKSNKIAGFQEVLMHAKTIQATHTSPTARYLRAVAAHLTNQTESVAYYISSFPNTSFDWLFKGLATHWIGYKVSSKDIITLREKYEAANIAGLKWFEILSKILSKKKISLINTSMAPLLYREEKTELPLSKPAKAMSCIEAVDFLPQRNKVHKEHKVFDERSLVILRQKRTKKQRKRTILSTAIYVTFSV